MGLIPPNELELDMPDLDPNLWDTMERLLNEQLYTYYVLGKEEKQNIRRGFLIGFTFARIGYLSRGIK
jgi:hypothetical protein